MKRAHNIAPSGESFVFLFTLDRKTQDLLLVSDGEDDGDVMCAKGEGGDDCYPAELMMSAHLASIDRGVSSISVCLDTRKTVTTKCDETVHQHWHPSISDLEPAELKQQSTEVYHCLPAGVQKGVARESVAAATVKYGPPSLEVAMSFGMHVRTIGNTEQNLLGVDGLVNGLRIHSQGCAADGKPARGAPRKNGFASGAGYTRDVLAETLGMTRDVETVKLALVANQIARGVLQSYVRMQQQATSPWARAAWTQLIKGTEQYVFLLAAKCSCCQAASCSCCLETRN